MMSVFFRASSFCGAYNVDQWLTLPCKAEEEKAARSSLECRCVKVESLE